MKTTAAAVCALLGASSVAAAPAKRGPTATSEFDVRGFSANTTPHGTGAYISFHVEIPGGDSTACAYADQSSAFRLPNIAMRACDNAAFEWQFRQFPARPGAEGDYLLLVTHAEDQGRRVAGYKEWPAGDFPVEQYGASVAQFFRGDPDFVISNVA